MLSANAAWAGWWGGESFWVMTLSGVPGVAVSSCSAYPEDAFYHMGGGFSSPTHGGAGGRGRLGAGDRVLLG